MLRKVLDIQPQILTISPTHKCTAACSNCCFACSPKISHILDNEKIFNYIDETISCFPSIKVLVITGGECFVLGKKLNEIIKYAKKLNLLTRVVSNGFWAKTYDIAYKKLYELKKIGLTEINFSTGDNHIEFVSVENVVNGVRAAV